MVPVGVAVGMTDLFYFFMAVPAMTTILILSPRVRMATRKYFDGPKADESHNGAIADDSKADNGPGNSPDSKG